MRRLSTYPATRVPNRMGPAGHNFMGTRMLRSAAGALPPEGDCQFRLGLEHVLAVALPNAARRPKPNA